MRKCTVSVQQGQMHDGNIGEFQKNTLRKVVLIKIHDSYVTNDIYKK